MNEYIVTNKTLIKSNNKSSYIFDRYFYSLIAFVILQVITYLIFDNSDSVLPLLKSLLISFIFTSIVAYLINIIFKDYNFINIYKKDNVHIIAIIIGLFAINVNILVLAIAIFVSIIIKKINQNINISSSLYGIIIIMIYHYFTDSLYIINDLLNIELNKKIITNYLIGTNFLNPILSLAMFVYLFIKKSIKYNIFIYYISTIFIITLIIGIVNNMHITLPFIVLASNNIIFLSIYILTDYMNTPTTPEVQIIYGIILGIVTTILTFVIPSFSVVIPMLLGPLLLTKLLDNNSYKIK